MPRSSKPSDTTNTFSMRCLCSNERTSSSSAPSRTVTSRSCGVMTVETGASRCVSKRKSRCVTIPMVSLPATTGTPEMPIALVRSMTARIVMSGDTVMGSRTMPLSNFLTLSTSRACISGCIFLWIMPRPPSCASAIARPASVTVSIAAESSGRFRVMPVVTFVLRSTSRGKTSE